MNKQVKFEDMETRNYEKEYQSLRVEGIVFLNREGKDRGIYQVVAIGTFEGEETKVTLSEYDNYDGYLENETAGEMIEANLKEVVQDFKLVEKRCHCGEKSYLIVGVDDYEKRERGGGLVQDCFPYLTIPQRELLKSGMCYDCQREIFSANYDENGNFIGL